MRGKVINGYGGRVIFAQVVICDHFRGPWWFAWQIVGAA